jgi:ornithine cyclodeaminase
MREVDDEAVCGAKIYVDTRAGALAEAGDLLDPISRGIISADDIAGDITDLTKGDGRSSLAETTIFKTVGSAASDLVAAEFAWTAA